MTEPPSGDSRDAAVASLVSKQQITEVIYRRARAGDPKRCRACALLLPPRCD